MRKALESEFIDEGQKTLIPQYLYIAANDTVQNRRKAIWKRRHESME
jgi:hypothetical protein